MFYYTYILRSEKDHKLYIGSTSNLKRRVRQHALGNVSSTKSRRPLRLVYYEACLNEKKASERELYFKTGYGRGFLKKRI